ncbi:MAG: tRNA-specific 2-thiouridylase MnmA [Parcubacteria group bacterium GW2011_GWB1_41_6]|nr:MAG: tRNA-specific 2-thiouridylase MnmA [Parcubacteria group bacterium GW2011_GWB1_41_6]
MGRKVGKKVFVAMSGGVDSSVAALLLKQKGYDVVGVFIKGWTPEGFVCPWREDKNDAVKVAAVLNIPFAVWDFSQEYKKQVADYMLAEYQAGRTPNPDVMCNKKIKFGIFLERALKEGADYIATGHYVKKKEVRPPRGGCTSKLLVAKDKNKDQSYFLWTLTQEQLKYCLFPIGDYLKSEVRQIAKKAGLPTAEKKESQGVCFVGKLDFADFLRKYIPKKEGVIKNIRGEVVGRHDGVHFYTIGQRRGLEIGGLKKPLYVAQKDFKNNVLIAAHKNDPGLYKKEILAGNINWIPEGGATSRGGRISLKSSLKLKVRIRYRQLLQECRVYAKNKGEVKVIFQKPQWAVAQGQSVVFYKGKEMLGGGVIR